MTRRVTFTQETLGLSSWLERVAQVQVKDCFVEEGVIYFVVGTGDLGKVVGKGGSTIRRIQEQLQRKVRVIEYRDQVTDFVRNIIYPLTVQDIIEMEDVVLLKDPHTKTKSLLIGRNGKHLQFINRALQRFFNKEVKVV